MRPLKAAGLAVALSLCAFLLGLSYAHDAVPGDMFQFVRAAPAHAAPAVDPALGKKAGSPDGKTFPHHVHPVAHETAAPATPLSKGIVVVPRDTVHSGRCGGTPGCRGPPTS